MRTKMIALATVAALGVSGCATTMTDGQRTTGTGASIGALAGAVIGAATAGSNKGKSTATGAAVGAAVGALGGYIWSQRMEEQRKQMEKATAGTGIDVTRTSDNRLKMNVPADVGFAVNSAQINQGLGQILNQFATGLVANPSANVYILGHTDNTGSDSINNPLSLNRAASARDYLVARGVGANRFNIEGRGSREPVADNSATTGRAQNRRVEVYVSEAAK